MVAIAYREHDKYVGSMITVYSLDSEYYEQFDMYMYIASMFPSFLFVIIHCTSTCRYIRVIPWLLALHF